MNHISNVEHFLIAARPAVQLRCKKKTKILELYARATIARVLFFFLLVSSRWVRMSVNLYRHKEKDTLVSSRKRPRGRSAVSPLRTTSGLQLGMQLDVQPGSGVQPALKTIVQPVQPPTPTRRSKKTLCEGGHGPQLLPFHYFVGFFVS